jgi:hypothetical protein
MNVSFCSNSERDKYILRVALEGRIKPMNQLKELEVLFSTLNNLRMRAGCLENSKNGKDLCGSLYFWKAHRQICIYSYGKRTAGLWLVSHIGSGTSWRLDTCVTMRTNFPFSEDSKKTQSNILGVLRSFT